MKKLLLLIIALVFMLNLAACSAEAPTENSDGKPPAFTVIERRLKLTKQSKKGESATFSADDFSNLLGENLTYITVSALPDATAGTLIFNGAAVKSGQTLPAGSLEYLKFVPASEAEQVAFTFTCDSQSFKGKELTCEIFFTQGINSPPVAADSVIETVSGITCFGELEITEPDGDDFTVNVITYPRDGFVTVSPDGKISYTPEGDFYGKDTLIYTVTDRFGAVSGQATLEFKVAENESGINFADMQDNPRHLYAYRMCENNTMVYRYENGSYCFDPEKEVTKIEFLVMMMSAAELDADIVAVADSAVTDDGGLSSGLKGYLSAATEKGLIKLENGSFSPKSQITVADAAYMVASALELPGVNTESVTTGTADRTFASIMAAANAGFFESMEPSHILNKEETAEILCRVADYIRENNMG